MNSKNIAVIIISLVVILSGGLLLIFNSQDNDSDNTELITNESSLVEDNINQPTNPSSSTLDTSDQSSDPSVVSGSTDEPVTTNQSSTQFQDGDYTQEDVYSVPRGGQEDITVNLTLEDDIVTDLSVELFATSGNSLEHQTNFKEGFDPDEFVGKNLEEVSLSRVTGASLTTAAFNKAISSIQSQAM